MQKNPFLPLLATGVDDGHEEKTEESAEEEVTIPEATTSKNKNVRRKLARQRKKQRDHEVRKLKEEEEEEKALTMMGSVLNNPPEPIEAAAAVEAKEDTDPNALNMMGSELNNPLEQIVAEAVEAVADEEDMDPNQFREKRLKMVESLKESVVNPYPHKFHVTMTIARYIRLYETLEDGERREDVAVSLSGRIMQKRMQSSKLMSYDLRGPGGLEVQLMVDASNSNMDVAEFTNFHSGVKRGDIVGVTGFPGRSNRGELSLFPRSFVVLNYTLHMMPREKAGSGGDNANAKKNDLWKPGSTRDPESYLLKDQETRYHQRYLDLMLNKEVPQIFRTRAMVIDYIRKFLKDLNFLEVETPVMNMIPGGAAAEPFVTHHNDLNRNLLMRFPPELYLQQLVIGGLERVFEIGKQFRNERADLTHYPEFTTCEFYEAYADYYDLMDRTETMLSGMVKELTGGYKVKYHANGFDKDPIEIDFTPPFRRIDMIEELEKIAGLDIPKDLSSDITNKYLLDACIKFDLNCPPPQTTVRLLAKLVEHFLEETCVNPTFIIDHPEILCPLAKSHRSKPGLTEYFDLLINKQEICNAYTELNDPVVQRQRFVELLKDQQSGVDEAIALDEEYFKAMEYGLPPTAGWGLEIDRLTMLLTDSQNIKEVILFPAMKPQDEPAPQGAHSQNIQEVVLFPAMKPQDEPAPQGAHSQNIQEVVLFPAMKLQDEPAPRVAHLRRPNNVPGDFGRRQGLILKTSLLFNCIFFMLLIYISFSM